MDSNVTISVFALIGIFLFGVAVGWTIANVRLRGSVNVRFTPTDIQRGKITGGIGFTKSLNTRTVRRMTLKCGCGAVWKFAEGDSPLPQGTQPLPHGDSFVCPNCGKAIDLAQERQLEAQAEAEALRNLKSKNQEQI